MKCTYRCADSQDMGANGRTVKTSLLVLLLVAAIGGGVALALRALDSDPSVAFWTSMEQATNDSWSAMSPRQQSGACNAWQEHPDLVLDKMATTSTLPVAQPDSVSAESVKDFYSNFLNRVCGVNDGQ